MVRIPLSDEACDRLVASRDPINAGRLDDEAVAGVSRRLGDELAAALAGAPASLQAAAPRRWQRGFGGRGHMVAVAVAAAVVAVLVIAASLPGGSKRDGPLDVHAASAAVVLDRAAQVAMQQPPVAPGRGQYGFVRVQTGSVSGTGPAVGTRRPKWSVWLRTSEVKSDWYSASGSGRERIVRISTRFLTGRDRAVARAHGESLRQLTASFPRVVDGAFAAGTLQTAGFLPYWQIGRLPTQPVALRRTLERLLVASAGKPAQASLRRQLRADPAGLFAPISQFLFLPTSPQLRAALFRVLARLPGVQLLGHQRDRLGRSGVAVAVTQGGPDRIREELLFDPATSSPLQIQAVQLPTSTASVPAGTVLQYTDQVNRGVVNSITQLPGGQRLPLKPADGTR